MNTKEDKYVLFICGGKWQEPWFKYLKDKGHKIILVDPYSTCPCYKLADKFIQLDARDTFNILTAVQNLQVDIEFVTSDQTDVSTLTVATLTEALGLYGNSVNSVKVFTNKFANRAFLKSHFSRHYPEFIQAYSPNQILDFFHKKQTPIIIKPVDAQSSRGVFKVDQTNIGLIPSYFNDSLSYSKETYVIAEEFIPGTEITVEGIWLNNKHSILAISSKKHFRPGIASELRYPVELDTNLVRGIAEFQNSFIQKSGLLFGITHTEYIINAKQTDFWLVEIACRGGGTLIPSHITPWVSGYNIYDNFYNLSIQTAAFHPDHVQKRTAILHFLEFGKGKVSSISGIDECRKLNEVFRIELEFGVNNTIYPASDDRGRQGFVIILANTITEAEEVLQIIYNTIKINFCE